MQRKEIGGGLMIAGSDSSYRRWSRRSLVGWTRPCSPGPYFPLAVLGVHRGVVLPLTRRAGISLCRRGARWQPVMPGTMGGAACPPLAGSPTFAQDAVGKTGSLPAHQWGKPRWCRPAIPERKLDDEQWSLLTESYLYMS